MQTNKPLGTSSHGIGKLSPGFSLLELLAVIAIMAIVLSLAATGMSHMSNSMQLTMAGQEVRNVLLSARREATSRNRPVEVRFCRADAGSNVRFVQMVVHESDGRTHQPARATKVNEMLLLETNDSRSTLFTQTNAAFGATGNGFVNNNLPEPLPELGTSYEIFSLFFRPDGSTSLPWMASNFPTITIRPNRNMDSPPANFVSLQIDPVTGDTAVFRP